MFLVLLALLIADFVMLVGRSVVMVSLLGLGRVLLRFSWMSIAALSVPPRASRALLAGTLPHSVLRC